MRRHYPRTRALFRAMWVLTYAPKSWVVSRPRVIALNTYLLRWSQKLAVLKRKVGRDSFLLCDCFVLGFLAFSVSDKTFGGINLICSLLSRL